MPRPKLYADTAARMRAYREAKKLGLTVPEYRARKAGTIVTPNVTGVTVTKPRREIPHGESYFTVLQRPAEGLDPWVVLDNTFVEEVIVARFKYKKDATEHRDKLELETEIEDVRSVPKEELDAIVRASVQARNPKAGTSAYRARKAEGTVTPLEQVAAAAAALYPNIITPSVTPRPSETAQQRPTTARSTFLDRIAEAKAKLTDIQARKDAPFAPGEIRDFKQFEGVIAPIVQPLFKEFLKLISPDGYEVLKADRGWWVQESDGEEEPTKAELDARYKKLVAQTVTPAPVTKHEAVTLKEGMLVTFKLYVTDARGNDKLRPMTFRISSLPEGDSSFRRNRLPEYKGKRFADVLLEVVEEPKPAPVTKPKAVDPKKELRIAMRSAQFYIGMIDELNAVRGSYADLLDLWSGKDGYPWTPPSKGYRLPPTEKQFQAEYDKTTTDFNTLLEKFQAAKDVTKQEETNNA